MFSYVRIACISPDLFDFTGLFSVGLVSRECACRLLGQHGGSSIGGASLVVWGHKYITFGHLGYFRGPGGDAGCLIFIHSSQKYEALVAQNLSAAVLGCSWKNFAAQQLVGAPAAC